MENRIIKFRGWDRKANNQIKSTEAEARGETLEYLLLNGLITL